MESSDEETPLLSSGGATKGRRKRKSGKKSQRESRASGEDKAKQCFQYVANMAEQSMAKFNCDANTFLT